MFCLKMIFQDDGNPRPLACLAAGYSSALLWALAYQWKVNRDTPWTKRGVREFEIKMTCKHMVSLCLFAKCNACSERKQCHACETSWQLGCPAGQFLKRSAQVCILSEESGSVCLPNDWSVHQSTMLRAGSGQCRIDLLRESCGGNQWQRHSLSVKGGEMTNIFHHLSIGSYRQISRKSNFNLGLPPCWLSPNAAIEFLILYIIHNYLIPLIIIMISQMIYYDTCSLWLQYPSQKKICWKAMKHSTDLGPCRFDSLDDTASHKVAVKVDHVQRALGVGAWSWT